MGRWLSFLFLFALFSYGNSIGCTTATSESQCASLTGCSWSGTACSGTFTPTCANTCYYIDPVSGSDSASGAASTPFKTLTPALTALTGIAGTIYVVNAELNTEAQLLQPANISSAISLTALFTDSKFVLSLDSFDTTSSKIAFSINSGTFTITRCIFNSKSIAPGGMEKIFNLLNVGLVFNNVDIKDSTVETVLVYAAATYTSSQFTYNTGTYSDAAFTFALNAGTQVLTNTNWINIGDVKSLFTLGLTHTFTNTFVSGGSSLFLTMISQSTLTITNMTFINYNGNFIDATAPKVIAISGSLFQNITQNITKPFIYATAAGTFTIAAPAITSTTFNDIWVRHSLMLMEQATKVMSLTSVVMNNIRKIPLTKRMKSALDLEYETVWPGGVCMLSRVATGYKLTSSNFTNIHSHCIGLVQSVLTMTSCIFDNTGLSSEYTSSLKNTSLVESDGVSFLSFSDGTTEANPGNLITLTSNQFINNVNYPKYGGGIRIIGTSSIQFTMVGNKFIGLGALYGGAVYCDNPLALLSSTDEVFQENTALNGAAIDKNSIQTKTIITGSKPTLFIDGGSFSSNVAIQKGGALFLDWESLGIVDSEFIGNSAQNGGVIYFIKENIYATVKSSINNSTFIANTASNSGGAIKVLFDSTDLIDDTMIPSNFTDNTDLKGLNVSDGKPSYYVFTFYDVITTDTENFNEDYSTWISNPNKTKYAYTLNSSDFPSDFKMKHKSGHRLMQLIQVEVYDTNHTLADYITDESITVAISETQNSLSDFKAFVVSSPVTATFKLGRLFLRASVTLIGQPRTSATLTLRGLSIASNILVDANKLIHQDFKVSFIDCEIGDIYSSSTQMCSTCPEGTYSLADPYSNPTCISCDSDVAVCLGGAQIAPKPGFWRYDVLSANIMECPYENACLGGLVNETYSPHGVCTYPYEGNLCNSCADSYAKFGTSSQCVNCKTSAMYYIKFVGFFGVQIVALLWGIRTNIMKGSKVKRAHKDENKEMQDELNNEDFQSNLMKVLVNFLQVSSIITQYKFEWPSFITNMGNVTGKIVPDDKNGFSVDCIIAMITKDNDSIYFIKLIITLIQPFAIWVLLILGYTLYLRVKKESLRGNVKLKRNIVVLFIITAFLFQPSVIQTTLEVFKCENFSSDNSPIYFMTDNSETKCWTAYHLLWGCAIAVPNFLLWTIIMPLVLFNVLRKRAKDLHDVEIYAKYSFVYEGLKKERYYWEFLIIGRKALVIIIFVFLNFVSVQSQAFATFLVVLAFTVAHYYAWPYVDEKLNRAELYSMLTLCVMVYSGMFFLSNGGNDWLNTIMIVISGLCSIALYCYLAVLFIKSYRKTAIAFRKKAKLVSQKLKEIKNNIQERRRTNRSGTSNSTSSDKKKSNTGPDAPDLKDLSLVLNKIQVDNSLSPDLGSPAELFSPDLSLRIEPLYPIDKNKYRDNYDSEDIKEEGHSIPTEYSDKVGYDGHRSKTVFNADRSDVDNCSVLRSSHVRSKTHRNTGTSNAQDILNELNMFNGKKTSLTSDFFNSNDILNLGRASSALEKRGMTLLRESTLVRDDSSNKQYDSQPLTPQVDKVDKKHTIIHEEPSDTHL